MTHHIAANLLTPSIFQSMQAALATPKKPTATEAASPAGSGSSATNSSGIGSTFLSLLTKELQNQNPSAPMDSTAMVGQMISLNQLDQLISIDQKFATPAGPVTPVTPAAGRGTLAPNSLVSPSASGATSTAERMTTPRPSAPSLADFSPFRQRNPSAPPEPIFGGVTDQLPIAIEPSLFEMPTTGTLGGR